MMIAIPHFNAARIKARALVLLAALSVSSSSLAIQGERWAFKTGDEVYALATSSDAAISVIGSRDSSAYVLDAAGKTLWSVKTKNAVTSVAVSPEGDFIAVASADSTLTLYDKAGKVIWSKTASGPLGSVALSSHAERVAYGINNTSLLNKDLHVYLLDHLGKALWTGQLTGSPVSLALQLNGENLAVGADDASLTVFDAAGKQRWQQGGSDIMTGVAISSDGSKVVGGSQDRSVYAFDATGKALFTYQAQSKIRALAMSSDGARIAFATSENGVQLLDAAGKVSWQEPSQNNASSVTISGNGDTVIAGFRSGNVSSIDLKLALSGASDNAFARLWQLGLVGLGILIALGLAVWYLRRNTKGQEILADWNSSRKRAWRARYSYVLLIPTFALLLIFHYYPAFSGLYHSLTKWDPAIGTEFIGLANFQAMLKDHYLAIGIGNVVVILIVGIFKTIVFPLFMAEVIFHIRSILTQYWARTAFVIPTIVPAVATILVWRFIYDPNLGILNIFLKSVGLESLTHSWLGEPNTALGSILAIGFPFISALPLLVLYAGLIGIPGELLESATMDGANALRRIWSIHLPLLAGQIRLLLILVFVGNIQDFTGILILTGGGPLDSTYVPGLEMYYHATRFHNLGYAAAIGVALFAVIMVFTLLMNRFLRPAGEYQT